jgi:hypothetical protein
VQCRKWFGFGMVRYMHVFLCFLFWRSRACACGGASWWGGNRLGDARRALYAARKLRAYVWVCVCVCERQLLSGVCLFAPRASRLLDRIMLASAVVH